VRSPTLCAQTLRVFYDRLVDDKDCSWLLDFMKTTVKVGGAWCAGAGSVFYHCLLRA